MYLRIEELHKLDLSKPTVILDPGHGKNTYGKRGNGLLEWEFNRDMAERMTELLEPSCNVFWTVTTENEPFTEGTPEGRLANLKSRTDVENKVSNYCMSKGYNLNKVVFISLHANYFSNPSASGWEIYVYQGGGMTEELAQDIMDANIKHAGLRPTNTSTSTPASKNLVTNRRIKVDQWYVLRNTCCNAVLIEHAFYSNLLDVAKLKSDIWRDKWALANSKGICNFLGVELKESEPNYDVSKMLPIMSKGQLTVQQMRKFLLDRNPNPKLTESVDTIIRYFTEECYKEGVNHDIAFCQAIKETGYFRYGGQVTWDQNNYCGLGATNDGAAGAKFDNARLGIRAQVQHLKAYGTTTSLNEEQIDPRYHLVPKGYAVYLEFLGAYENPKNYIDHDFQRGIKPNTFPTGWCYKGETYGHDIRKLIEDAKKVIITEDEKPTPPDINPDHDCQEVKNLLKELQEDHEDLQEDYCDLLNEKKILEDDYSHLETEKESLAEKLDQIKKILE